VTAKGEARATPPARIYPTDQQRREVHRRLFRQGKVEGTARNRLGISLAVGNQVPRHHRLPALIALAPFYAAYSYIVVDDTICEIPRSVELYVFPTALIAQVPQVASFR
jgi:hypothetical protein